MLSSGLVVCLGLVMWFIKCSWRVRLMILSFPLVVDMGVFTFLTLLHWGTFSGVMAATFGAFMVSCLLSAGRKVFGFTKDQVYHAGFINIHARLMAEKGLKDG